MSVLNSLISPADHSIRSFHLFSLPFLFSRPNKFSTPLFMIAHTWNEISIIRTRYYPFVRNARGYITGREIVERVYSFFLAFLESLQLNLWIKVCVLICSLIWMDEYLLGEGRSIFLRLKNWNRKRRVCKS